MEQLKEEYDIIALSRSTKNKEDEAHITRRACDLFSYEATKEACEGADYAMFLVHSMIPDGGLTQATFEDMDALIADNFARATKANDIEQIVYLSGIIPKQEKTLSRHLKSRLEVERILGGQGVPVTTIRAGLIIGPEGSSRSFYVSAHLDDNRRPRLGDCAAIGHSLRFIYRSNEKRRTIWHPLRLTGASSSN